MYRIAMLPQFRSVTGMTAHSSHRDQSVRTIVITRTTAS
jgi:hypothetical protein